MSESLELPLDEVLPWERILPGRDLVRLPLLLDGVGGERSPRDDLVYVVGPSVCSVRWQIKSDQIRLDNKGRTLTQVGKEEGKKVLTAVMARPRLVLVELSKLNGRIGGGVVPLGLVDGRDDCEVRKTKDQRERDAIDLKQEGWEPGLTMTVMTSSLASEASEKQFPRLLLLLDGLLDGQSSLLHHDVPIDSDNGRMSDSVHETRDESARLDSLHGGSRSKSDGGGGGVDREG